MWLCAKAFRDANPRSQLQPDKTHPWLLSPCKPKKTGLRVWVDAVPDTHTPASFLGEWHRWSLASHQWMIKIRSWGALTLPVCGTMSTFSTWLKQRLRRLFYTLRRLGWRNVLIQVHLMKGFQQRVAIQITHATFKIDLSRPHLWSRPRGASESVHLKRYVSDLSRKTARHALIHVL